MDLQWYPQSWGAEPQKTEYLEHFPLGDLGARVRAEAQLLSILTGIVRTDRL